MDKPSSILKGQVNQGQDLRIWLQLIKRGPIVVTIDPVSKKQVNIPLTTMLCWFEEPTSLSRTGSDLAVKSATSVLPATEVVNF